MATTDVDNCFHRLKIGRQLGEYFCLPPLRASDLGITQVNGEVVEWSDLVWPCLAALPMGFSWSLFLAQDATTLQTESSACLATSRRIEDRNGAVVICAEHPLAHYVYVDNVGALGTSEEGVAQAILEVEATLTAMGLVCHETEGPRTAKEALGVEFNRELQRWRGTAKRFWTLSGAIRYFLGRKRATGEQLEVILGHCTFYAMLE